MLRSVVVVIPPASDVLGSFARAILEGAIEAREEVTGTIEIAPRDGSLVEGRLASLVFVGCCPEERGSREVTEAIVARLLASGSGVRGVARFDVHRVDADGATAATPAGGNVMDGDRSTMASVPERFAVEVRVNMFRPNPEELARARAWSARVAFQHRATPNEVDESREDDPSQARTSPVPWCGATD